MRNCLSESVYLCESRTRQDFSGGGKSEGLRRPWGRPSHNRDFNHSGRGSQVSDCLRKTLCLCKRGGWQGLSLGDVDAAGWERGVVGVLVCVGLED